MVIKAFHILFALLTPHKVHQNLILFLELATLFVIRYTHTFTNSHARILATRTRKIREDVHIFYFIKNLLLTQKLSNECYCHKTLSGVAAKCVCIC